MVSLLLFQFIQFPIAIVSLLYISAFDHFLTIIRHRVHPSKILVHLCQNEMNVRFIQNILPFFNFLQYLDHLRILFHCILQTSPFGQHSIIGSRVFHSQCCMTSLPIVIGSAIVSSFLLKHSSNSPLSHRHSPTISLLPINIPKMLMGQNGIVCQSLIGKQRSHITINPFLHFQINRRNIKCLLECLQRLRCIIHVNVYFPHQVISQYSLAFILFCFIILNQTSYQGVIGMYDVLQVFGL